MIAASLVLSQGVPLATSWAQEVVRIKDGDRCPHAEWSIRDDLVFGSDAEVGLRGPVSGVYRRPEGGAAIYYAGRVHLFGVDGRLQHSFGGRGQGPGEFGNVQVIRFADSGRIETYDGQNARRTVFGGAPKFDVEATHPFPMTLAFTGTLFHPNGRIVVNRNLATRESAGLPIHLLEADGTLLRSFGNEPRELRPGVSFPLRRSVAWSGSSHEALWVGHVRQYRLERWSVEGRLLEIVDRDVPWFKPWEVDGPLSPSTPPPPRIEHLDELDGGLLVVLLMVPTAEPSKGMELRDGAWRATRVDKMVKGRIEVLNVGRRCVVTSFDIPGYPLRFLDDGSVALYQESDETGLASIRLVRIHRR
jgi:hypothetical protein